MKSLIILICLLFSISLFAKDKLTATPTNSPVKETYVKVKLEGFTTIAEVFFKPKNGPTEFQGEVVKEGSTFIGKFKGSSLKPGTYEYRAKIRTTSGKSEQDETVSTAFFTFVIDASLEVADPDPKLNDATLAGIDTDLNKIRDDIQRWINETYANKPNTKLGLKKYAKSFQSGLLNSKDVPSTVAEMTKFSESFECLAWIVGDKIDSIHDSLHEKMLNTELRIKQNLNDSRFYHGQGRPKSIMNLSIEERNQLCDFNAQKEL